MRTSTWCFEGPGARTAPGLAGLVRLRWGYYGTVTPPRLGRTTGAGAVTLQDSEAGTVTPQTGTVTPRDGHCNPRHPLNHQGPTLPVLAGRSGSGRPLWATRDQVPPTAKSPGWLGFGTGWRCGAQGIFWDLYGVRVMLATEFARSTAARQIDVCPGSEVL